MKELDLIRWIRREFKSDPRIVKVAPGDDCAVVRCGSEDLLVTTDQVLDGIHFILSRDGAVAAGRKALARNLSDIAAMAARPLAAVACVSLPKGISAADCRGLCRGMQRLGEQFDCPIVGGDVAAWNGPLALSVTVFGRPVPGVKPVLRSGALAGDAICVTGALGGAWKTTRHLRLTPRIREAAAIAASCKIHAMIDISDGLLRDLGHICDESGVGAELVAASIPVHRSAEGLAAALTDGEDYELLFTVSPKDAKAVAGRTLAGVRITRIGTITKRRGIAMIGPNGKRIAARAAGWEHRA